MNHRVLSRADRPSQRLMLRRGSLSASSTATSEPSSASASTLVAPRPDYIKLFTFLISLLGIQAWISGECYLAGYWSGVGWDGPIQMPSVQRTALIGFLQTPYNWFWGAMTVSVLGIYVLILSISVKRESKGPAPVFLRAIGAWIQRRLECDRAVAAFGAKLFVAGIGLFLVVILPLALWISMAYKDGASQFRLDVCQIKKGLKPTTNIKLNDGAHLDGLILERSDRYNVVLNGEGLHMLTAADRPQLLYSASLAAVKCQPE